MGKKILWIDDDYYHIQELFSEIRRKGFQVDYARAAYEGYKKIISEKYDLIVVDIILPMRSGDEKLPDEVTRWKEQKYPGIGLIQWLINERKIKNPIVIISVLDNPIESFQLMGNQIKGALPKLGLGPSKLWDFLKEYLPEA